MDVSQTKGIVIIRMWFCQDDNKNFSSYTDDCGSQGGNPGFFILSYQVARTR